MSEQSHVVVVGAGAFGTALATVVAETGESRVTLLARRAETVAAIQRALGR